MIGTALHPAVGEVTRRLAERSRITRPRYLARSRRGPAGPVVAAGERRPPVGVAEPVLAAVQLHGASGGSPRPPAALRDVARRCGVVARFAGAVPVFCGADGRDDGSDLPLLARDVVAMSAAVALGNGTFGGALLTGVCGNTAPGAILGALTAGHLPIVVAPVTSCGMSAGPSRAGELSSRLLVEALGVAMPGSATAPVTGVERAAQTEVAAVRLVRISRPGPDYTTLAEIVDERAIVNAVVAMLATGGTTHQTLHLVAIAAAAGLDLRWEDFDELSAGVPLLVRPGAGPLELAAAGGSALLFRDLLDAGLLHADVRTVAGPNLRRYTGHHTTEPYSGRRVLRPAAAPVEGNRLRVLRGNLGRAVMQVSALPAGQRVVRAPVRVFDDRLDVGVAYRAGELDRDVVVVLRGQGPVATGMDEVFGLTEMLAALAGRGHRVALVTDGRLGACGATAAPVAVHLTPEAQAGGVVGLLRDGDEMVVDAFGGELEALVGVGELDSRRRCAPTGLPARDPSLWTALRDAVGPADRGATTLGGDLEPWTTPRTTGHRQSRHGQH
jgi:phosphogluconate dehydratase